MASKTVEIAGVGIVHMQKRRSSRHMRLSISHDGLIKLSLPYWTPYKIAEAFARSKASWLQSQLAKRPVELLKHNDRIGKGHRLQIIHAVIAQPRTRVASGAIIITLPQAMAPSDEAAQSAIRKAAMRALQAEGSHLLPQRLQTLAEKYDFDYTSVRVRQLKSRWGSCNSQKEIVLSYYLMQLPWDLIDYVLLHELMHTRIMAHGSRFWDELDHFVQDLKTKRKVIKEHRPVITPYNG